MGAKERPRKLIGTNVRRYRAQLARTEANSHGDLSSSNSPENGSFLSALEKKNSRAKVENIIAEFFLGPNPTDLNQNTQIPTVREKKLNPFNQLQRRLPRKRSCFCLTSLLVYVTIQRLEKSTPKH